MKSIPEKFKLFGTTIKVVWDDSRMNDMKSYGLYEHSESKITLSRHDGLNKLSKDKIKDTFYHEKTHAILEAMHEYDLSANEKFVDTFAKLLRQSDETSKQKNKK